MSREELKAKARKSLEGKYVEAIKMFVIYFLINFAAGFVLGFVGKLFNIDKTTLESLNNILSFIMNALLMFGYTNFFLKISRGEEVTYKEVFSKTDMFIPYILISLLTSLFTILWSFLFIIPGIIAAISYSFVYYIALDNPHLKPKEVINKSKEMLDGHKMDLFILELSFIGWAILGIFTLGILYLWLVPYIAVTEANFYNSLKEKKSL